jgi:hypothetical protein
MKPLVLLLPLMLGAASAPTPRKLESLFARRAQVTVTQAGANAVVLPSELLQDCKPDWSDLRLFDARGTQVPYLLDRGGIRPPPPATLEHPTLKTVSRREIEAAGFPHTFEEMATLTAPSSSNVAWTLEVDSSTHAFVTQLQWAWRTKNKEGPSHAVSIFRLADGRSQLSVPLEGPPGSELRVTLRGENGHFLEPRFRYRRNEAQSHPGLVSLSMPVQEQVTTDKESSLGWRRPKGWVPSELVFETSTPTFSRRVTVYDLDDAEAAALIGTGTVSRLSPDDSNARLTIRLAPARGNRMRVVIENGDSPPLAQLVLNARAVAPRMLFLASNEHLGNAKLSLYFGSTRVNVADYDVARLEHALVARQFANAANASVSSLGENPLWDSSPPLQYAWTPGAVVETSTYSHRVALGIVDAPEGVARLAVPVDVMAKARPDLADLRIIDATAHQIPYVRFATALTPQWVLLQMGNAAREAGETRLKLQGPGGSVPWTKLRLHVDSQFVERSFTVEGTLASGKTTPLTSGTLRRADGSAAELDIDLPGTAVSELEVRFKEGDAAPLTLSAVEGQTLLPLLHVLAPAGQYTLLVGQPEATAPQYQLESLRELVSQLDAPAITAIGQLESNPDFTRLARLRQGSGPERVAVWGVLGLGVLVLGAFTLRLLRKQPVS